MRKILIFGIALIYLSANSQKMVTKTGIISFDGSVPSFEPVRAKNESVTCVLNAGNGQIASLALVKAFRFKTALMEEHFNENYIESEKYPKSILKGKLINFDKDYLSDKPKEYFLKGNIELHGVKKDVLIKVFISKTSKGVDIVSDFPLNASDFGIVIPGYLKSKLTDIIQVKIEFNMIE
jgi:YceI-like domain